MLHQKQFLICIAICSWALVLSVADAQFETVVNIPPDSFPEVIESSTQINISGRWPSVANQVGLDADLSSVEINLIDGSIYCFDDIFHGVAFNIKDGLCEGSLNAHSGSTVNVSGGTAGFVLGDDLYPDWLTAKLGSTVRVTGGELGWLRAEEGSIVEISGGTVYSLLADNGSDVTIDGGAIYGISVESESALTLRGSDFRLNGNLVAGLSEVGDRISVELGESVDLTGSLADGSLFFATGEPAIVTLEMTEIPRSDQGTFRVAFSEPVFVRNGEKLIVDRSVISDVLALHGSEVEFTGNGGLYSRMTLYDSKLIRRGGSDSIWGTGILRTIRSDVEIYGGDSIFTAIDSSTLFAGGIYESVTIQGGTATLSDGEISQLNVSDGADVTLTLPVAISATFSDSVFRFQGDETLVWGTTTARNSTGVVDAGEIYDLVVQDGSHMTIRGGGVASLKASGGSKVVLQGGSVAYSPSGWALANVSKDAEFHIYGTELLLDGAPIAGLDGMGDSIVLTSREGRTLSGSLLDGNEFSYVLSDEGAIELDGILRLTRAVPFAFCDFDSSGACDVVDLEMFQSNLGGIDGLSISTTTVKSAAKTSMSGS